MAEETAGVVTSGLGAAESGGQGGSGGVCQDAVGMRGEGLAYFGLEVAGG